MKTTFLFYSLITSFSFSQISESKLDDVVSRTMKTFNVPGIAGNCKDGKVVISKVIWRF
jgi:hypothetical protein